MRGTRAGGVYDWDLDYLSPLMSLVYVSRSLFAVAFFEGAEREWSPLCTAAPAAVAVCFEKRTALSRGWCTPLTRGSAVCEQNASHNTQILACFPDQLD